jgi:hypothetical protein
MSGQKPAQHIGPISEATAGVWMPETRATPIIDNAIKAPLKIFFIFFSPVSAICFVLPHLFAQLTSLLSNRGAKGEVFIYVPDLHKIIATTPNHPELCVPELRKYGIFFR